MALRVASPSAAPGGVANTGPVPRPASRNLNRNPPLRLGLKRRSPLAAPMNSNNPPRQHQYMTRSRAESLPDSSDDEGAAPALSAAAEELLRTQDRLEIVDRGLESKQNGAAGLGSPVSRNKADVSRLGSTTPRAAGSPSPRIVKISRNSPQVPSSLRRTNSTSSIVEASPRLTEKQSDLKTPAARPRSALASSTNVSSTTVPSRPSAAVSAGSRPASKAENTENKADAPVESRPTARQGLRSQTEDRGLHNSIRIKRTERVGGFTGNFLKGPARRGIIRRQSEDDQSPSKAELAVEPAGLYDGDEQAADASQPPKGSPESNTNHVRFAAPKPETPGITAPPLDSHPPSQEDKVGIMVLQDESNVNASTEKNHVPLEKYQAPVFKIPPPLPSLFDQENDPPPTFKRNKPGLEVFGVEKLRAQSVELPRAHESSPRKALAPRNQNTPLRPAPPPPKMSVLETATATAGAASTAQNKKKKNYISVNGKLFSRMECIGRGGSGRVYRVMAENFKLFALKRVSLEDVDEMAVRGFKGEIDLLRKLEKVERVVRLFDYEINDEKKTLSVLMDIGELDLKKILDPRLDEGTGRLDLTFTRNTWKEMLECVQAIHEHDVVHSDLKPANFVMMQGRLKLIDFGIANAIQDDTVNVHREHQIGTPNYMAPEALLDTNAMAGRTSNLGKLMKLGKPSDVWSLGCILYQIVYGKPPFGHIPNPMNKVMAITDRTHAISFPEHGVGGVPVPTGLIRTMKRTLNRDPAQRPTVLQLLDARDTFLYPDAPGTLPINQEIVRKLQENVLKIIEAKGMPAAEGKSKDEAVKEWLDQWSPQLFASIKASLEKGAA